MSTSRVKTKLFLTFEIAAKLQNVCYTRRSYRLILYEPKQLYWKIEKNIDKSGNLSASSSETLQTWHHTLN